MNRVALTVVFGLISTAAFAQEPVGCDKFKWPLDRERALLTGSSIKTIENGATIDVPTAAAVKVKLVSSADVKLPIAPERAPKASSYSGFVNMADLKEPGTYKITLSAGGWIDVVQNDRTLRSTGFSGVQGCDGIRKSVKFDLARGSFVVQFSGVPTESLGMVVTPATE